MKRINDEVCRGVAGKMKQVKGIVFHNTSDHLTAEQHRNRLKGMTPQQLAQGFAHYFVDDTTVVRTEHTYNGAWHVANEYGNYHYIGIEVTLSTSDEKRFLKAEQNGMKLALELLKYYKLPINSETVKLHSEFVPTACPHRTVELHGGTHAKAKQWLIDNLTRMNKGEKPQVKPVAPAKPKPVPVNPPAKVGAWYNERGSYKLQYATNLRTSPSRNGGFIATLPAGSVVKYDKFIHTDGHVWIRQPRGNNTFGYLATGESVNGRRKTVAGTDKQIIWGTFY